MSVEESEGPAATTKAKSLWRKNGIAGDIDAANIAIKSFWVIVLSCRPIRIQLGLTIMFSVLAVMFRGSSFPLSSWIWFIVIQCFGFLVEMINTTFERVGDFVGSLAKGLREIVQGLRDASQYDLANRLDGFASAAFGPIQPGQPLEYNRWSKLIKDGGAAVTTPIAILAFLVEPILIFFVR